MTKPPSDPDADKTDLNSPACAMRAGDDVYMGYAGSDEIAAFLNAWETAQPSPSPDLVEALRAMLPRIRDDRLHARLKNILSQAP